MPLHKWKVKKCCAGTLQDPALGLVEPDNSHTLHDLCFLLPLLNSLQKLWAAPVVAEQQDVSSVKKQTGTGICGMLGSGPVSFIGMESAEMSWTGS